MIDDLDRTIRQLLIDELQITNGEIDISFEQPKREWSAGVNKAINFYLYDVRENAQLRQHQWEQLVNGRMGRQGEPIVEKRTPLRVDCFYLITTWAKDPRDEHDLLSRCLLVLFRYPILPEDRLQNRLQNPRFEIRTRLANHDVLTNPAEVWSALDNEMRPSISYVVTISLDPWKIKETEAVRTASLRIGKRTQPEVGRRPAASPGNFEIGDRSRLKFKQQLVLDKSHRDITIIGGTVWETKGGKALADTEVAIEGTGLYTRTDEQGCFRLRGLRPGTYQLVARQDDRKSKPLRIVVPSSDDKKPDRGAGIYDIVMDE